MGRKPNYRADRIERERAKATKKAKRMEAKAGKGKQDVGETPADEGAHDVPEVAVDDDSAEDGEREESSSS